MTVFYRVPYRAGQHVRQRIGALARQKRLLSTTFDGYLIRVTPLATGGVSGQAVDPPVYFTAVDTSPLVIDGTPYGRSVAAVYAHNREAVCPEAPVPASSAVTLGQMRAYGTPSLSQDPYAYLRFGPARVTDDMVVFVQALLPPGVPFSYLGIANGRSGLSLIPILRDADRCAMLVRVQPMVAGLYRQGDVASLTAARQYLSLLVTEDDVSQVAPNYKFVQRDLDTADVSVYGVNNPIVHRGDAALRRLRDNPDATDELLLVAPIVRQDAIDGQRDTFGRFSLYLALARANRAAFDAEAPAPLMQRVNHRMFDCGELPYDLPPKNSEMEDGYGNFLPVWAPNWSREIRVARYASGYAVAFNQCSTWGGGEATMGVVLLRVTGDALDAQVQVLAYDVSNGLSTEGMTFPDDYPFDRTLLSITSCVSGASVGDTAVFALWTKTYARDPRYEATGDGYWTFVVVSDAGVVQHRVDTYACPMSPLWDDPNGVNYSDADRARILVTRPAGANASVHTSLCAIGPDRVVLPVLNKDETLLTSTHGPIHVMVLNIRTGQVEIRGDIVTSRPYADHVATITCVVEEQRDDAGVVTRPASLLATYGDTQQDGTIQQTLVSVDGGFTWQVLFDNYRGAAGVFFAGNELRPYTTTGGISLSVSNAQGVPE